MDALVEHWFNRRYGAGRRDIYLRRDSFGWYIRARQGGADGQEVTHPFDNEHAARAMVGRLKATTPHELSNWALMPSSNSTR